MVKKFQFSKIPRPVLIITAIIYAASAILFSTLWMIDARAKSELPIVELGFGQEYIAAEHVILVKNIYPESPAEKMGLKSGDKISAINSHEIDDENYLYKIWKQHNPGDTVNLNVVHAGTKRTIQIKGVFRYRQSLVSEETLSYLASQVRSSYPVPFILIGLILLFLHLEDPIIWILALLFGSLASTPGFSNNLSAAPSFIPFAFGYQVVFICLLGPLFYTFFAVFPVRSSIDIKAPWLKYIIIIFGISFSISGFTTDHIYLPPPFHYLVGQDLSGKIAFFFMFLFILLGLISLSLNYIYAKNKDVKRKIRIIFWGAGIGVTPSLINAAAQNLFNFRAPVWLSTLLVLLLFLFPISFAYAVVKHRVLEIPVLLKRSVRYLLVQRGFTISLSIISIILVFFLALFLSRYLKSNDPFAIPFAVALGSAFGTALLWGGNLIHRKVSGKIDKAFFRSVYDARIILENLAEQSASILDPKELTNLMKNSISEALYPDFIDIYIRSENETLNIMYGEVPSELEKISTVHPFFEILIKEGKVLDYTSLSKNDEFKAAGLFKLNPECIVPMIAHRRQLTGLIVLGARRSEEQYSGEDKRMLNSVAAQAASALENIRLVEEIAAQKEAEQKVLHEMEISQKLLEADNARKTKELEEARTLQLSMLPSSIPEVPNLKIEVYMKTATEVGGDYYDFAVSSDGSLTVALGDATGHGAKAGTMVVAAKSLFTAFADTSDLLEIFERFTVSIKQLNMYSMYMAMMLLRIKESKVIVASAGMPFPLVYRASPKKVEQITLKGMPLGAFYNFPYKLKEFILNKDDVLILMSDGLPEMFNEKKEMFGFSSVKDIINEAGDRSPKEIIEYLLKKGEEWHGKKALDDDMTFVVIKME